MEVDPAHAEGARAVLGQAGCLLLDFDGPLCRVFADLDRAALVADLVRVCAALGVPLPDDVAATGDPMAALGWTAGRGLDVRLAVERVVQGYEVAGARRAAVTPGAVALVAAARAAGIAVAVVTNNSAHAVAELAARVGTVLTGVPVVGRVAGRPAELKPSPVLVRRALDGLGVPASRAVLVGDSVGDVVAARAAGVRSVALVLRPEKADRLAAARPDAIVTSLLDLADPWGAPAPG